MPFSQIFPPSPSPTESTRLFYTSVSLLLSRTHFCHLKELVLKAEDVIFKKLHFCTSEWSALNIIMPAMYRYMLVYK